MDAQLLLSLFYSALTGKNLSDTGCDRKAWQNP